MEQLIANLIAGALGGVGAGKASEKFDLGTAGNLIAGAVGGGVLGQIVPLLMIVGMLRWLERRATNRYNSAGGGDERDAIAAIDAQPPARGAKPTTISGI